MKQEEPVYYQSPIGTLLLRADSDALLELQLCDEKIGLTETVNPILQETIRQLTEYFERKRQIFELPLKPQGTDFQRKVWNSLCQIPYGTTTNYAGIARSIGHPKAYRAVGNANGKNPIAIIIPCHRVIASDGSLGGYAYGLAIKEELLQLERP
ncbi:MAG: methylated-DNA--[protein]-cysteine S-methyltransferase [Candidatus Symbiothrix sp.]|jgi:methylated-DNA-[protein]-cysteine S-methyltransferase|nr:methylated-DNA--[protein]-cysteine S-methyltransferase [Candidatus Symbiothrix sp.]